MGNFIDDRVIWLIVNDNDSQVKEIIKTTMKISPFGISGERTYIVEYKKINNEIKYLKIDNKTYSNVFKTLTLT